jgi:Ca2+-binding EF-hand superfamily protein
MLKFISLLIALLAISVPALAQDRPAASASNRGVMRFDANKDGFVDRTEWRTAQEARFKELDANTDGKLNPDELVRRPAGATGVLPTDAQNTRQSRFFNRLDSDKDAFVSKAEYMAEGDRRFVRCDANKDGRINTEECRQALRR